MELCNVQAGQTYEPIVIALGNFDGVHLGHQKLLKCGLEQAKSLKVKLAVLLFYPHPLKVLYPERRLELLTGHEERLKLFEEIGVHKVFIMPFTSQLAATSPQEFVEEILLKLGAVHVVVGFNYSFGYKGKGNPELLKEYGKQYGFKVRVIQAQKMDDRIISSTEIRKYLLNGEIDLAKKMMGRCPKISGKVVHGDGRGGKILGFPTANIETDQDLLIPKNGVYIISTLIGEKKYGGMMNIGFRPTFKTDAQRTVEVNLFGYNGDLYGERLSIDVESRLRPERKFSDQEEIIAQLNRDKEQAIAYFIKE